MLTKKQAEYLLEQFKRATEFVWNEQANKLEPSPIKFADIENIIKNYTMTKDIFEKNFRPGIAEDDTEMDLICDDMPTHFYLRGIADAVLCSKCAISEEAEEFLSTEMTADEFRSAVEEAIDTNIDYMLCGD